MVFPRIDAMIAKLLDECIACCASYDQKYCHPGNGPICVPISMVHCHPASIYFIVVLDEYSRFPEVEIVKSLSAQTLIPIFDSLFVQGYTRKLEDWEWNSLSRHICQRTMRSLRGL